MTVPPEEIYQRPVDIHEALYTTRAMRRLKPDPVPLDVQARILDAAIRAPNIDQQWRFLLIDDRQTLAQLAEIYRKAWRQLFEQFGVDIADLLQAKGPHGSAARSGDHLARHFQDVPLVLIGFGRTRDGSGIYPALWSAMLAARAEGIGSTLTAVMQSFCADEVFALLGVPADEGWYMHGAIPMGYPRGRWGVAARKPLHGLRRATAGRVTWASAYRSRCGLVRPGRRCPRHSPRPSAYVHCLLAIPAGEATACPGSPPRIVETTPFATFSRPLPIESLGRDGLALDTGLRRGRRGLDNAVHG
jgi:nitroreductase